MSAECPVCEAPIPLKRLVFGGGLSGYWTCETCLTHLRFSGIRKFGISFVTAFAASVIVLRAPNRYWLILLLVTPIVAVVIRLRGQRVLVVQVGPGYCASCFYNLTGLTSNRCPECGARIPEKIRN